MIREFEYIITNITEKEKQKGKETVLNQENSLFNEFSTTERYPISRLIVLFNYLSDLAIDFPLLPGDVLFESRGKSSKNARIHTQVRVLDRILNISDDVPSVIDEDVLILLNAYGYRSNHCKGRLYGRKNTMTLISRQCRYYLFHDLYFDVDLKNAHPTMLLFYAESNGINTPELKRYVNNREEFLAEIMNKSEITRDEAKIQVLRAINLLTDKYLLTSLKPLFNEILPIREHLFNANLGNTPTELGSYCLTRESFMKRNLAQQKISLQSHYCTTEESKCLEILREVCLHKGLLDKESKLTKKARNLSFIPFFDGAYVSFSSLLTEKQIESILKDTNDLIAPYSFELKKIKPEWDFINETDLKHYQTIGEIMEGISLTKLDKLINFLGIPPFSLNEIELKNILEEVLKKKKKKKKDPQAFVGSKGYNDIEEEVDKRAEFFKGKNEDFNSLVAKSAKQYLYRIRRALLVVLKENRRKELDLAISGKTHST